MTVKNYESADGEQRSAITLGTRKATPIRRLCRRYAMSLATLSLAATAAPLFSSTALASPVGVSPNSTAPVVSYGGGLVTSVVDENGDVLLFTQATGAPTWTKRTIATATGAVEYFDPEISSNGNGGLIIVAKDSNGHLESWSGRVGGKFQEFVVSESSTYSTPSVAYSPTGENFVITATDASDNIDFWYLGSTGWTPELVESGQFVHFLAAVVTVTDTGVLVVGTDNEQELDAFYQPYFASGWTLTSTKPGGYIDLSVVWSGTDVLVATDQAGAQAGDQSLNVISYSDKGVAASDTAVGESSTTGFLTGTAIAWSGFNAVVVSQDAQGDGALNFFYSDSGFVFHKEPVATGNAGRGYGFFPGIAVANSSVEITDVSDADLYGFSQAVGASGWPRQVIAR
jgi:hypothetical protein